MSTEAPAPENAAPPAPGVPPERESLLDKALSERVLYPLLGLMMVLALVLFTLRRKDYGPAPELDLAVVRDTGELGVDRVRLRDLRGKPVLLDFWATWCGPCRAETPILVRLDHRYRARGLHVVGVNVDETGPAVVPEFKRFFGIEYPIVYDLGAMASGRFGVQGLPTLVLIDRDGHVRYRHAGMASEEQLAEMIERVL